MGRSGNPRGQFQHNPDRGKTRAIGDETGGLMSPSFRATAVCTAPPHPFQPGARIHDRAQRGFPLEGLPDERLLFQSTQATTATDAARIASTGTGPQQATRQDTAYAASRFHCPISYRFPRLFGRRSLLLAVRLPRPKSRPVPRPLSPNRTPPLEMPPCELDE